MGWTIIRICTLALCLYTQVTACGLSSKRQQQNSVFQVTHQWRRPFSHFSRSLHGPNGNDCCPESRTFFQGDPGQGVSCLCSGHPFDDFEGVGARGGVRCCIVGSPTDVKQKLRLQFFNGTVLALRALETTFQDDCGKAVLCMASCRDALYKRSYDTEPAVSPGDPAWFHDYVTAFESGYNFSGAGTTTACDTKCLSAAASCNPEKVVPKVWEFCFDYFYGLHHYVGMPSYEAMFRAEEYYREMKVAIYDWYEKEKAEAVKWLQANLPKIFPDKYGYLEYITA